jgi:pyruvate/2-oxoacid:ferredoxin oxidoreductase beta subunit
MIFKELILKTEYDEVWKELQGYYDYDYDIYYKAYQNVILELEKIDPKSSDPPTTIVVAKTEDWLKPGEYIFDVFGIISGDKNHYALEWSPWNEWLGFSVLDKSIQIYGESVILAHSLYEMTFFGYNSSDVAKKIRKEKVKLDKNLKEIEEGKAKLIPHEEFMSEFGISEERSQEEIEKDRKECEKIAARNKEVYRLLLD